MKMVKGEPLLFMRRDDDYYATRGRYRDRAKWAIRLLVSGKGNLMTRVWRRKTHQDSH